MLVWLNQLSAPNLDFAAACFAGACMCAMPAFGLSHSVASSSAHPHASFKGSITLDQAASQPLQLPVRINVLIRAASRSVVTSDDIGPAMQQGVWLCMMTTAASTAG